INMRIFVNLELTALIMFTEGEKGGTITIQKEEPKGENIPT
ncbi:hypothetical protein LCGC14_2209320, partial [marine sediment metagenome]